MNRQLEIYPAVVHGFLVDMGRWRRVASIEKVVRTEIGPDWEVTKIRPLDVKGRKFLVEAQYHQPQRETVSYAMEPVIKEKEPVMGQDIFSKTQMRRVQAELMAERETRISLEEKIKNMERLDEDCKNCADQMAMGMAVKQEKDKIKNSVSKPAFMKEVKATETPFQMLRNCVLQRLSDLDRFDCKNVNVCAEACGAKDRGFEIVQFTRSFIVSCLKLKLIEPAGYRDDNRCYKMTEEGKRYLEEVRSENK